MNKTARLILNVLNRKPEGVSVADIIIETGLSYKNVIENINRICKLDSVQFKVTEYGDILYYIDDRHRYNNNSAFNLQPDFLETTASIFFNFLISLIKIFFSVILSLYFFLSYGFILIFSFLSTVNRQSLKEARTTRIGLLNGIFGVINLLTQAVTVKKSAKGKKKKKEIVEFILKNKGVITLTELIAFTGTTTDKANQIINDLLLQYRGEPIVTKSGTLIFQFPLLLKAFSSIKLSLKSENKYNFKKIIPCKRANEKRKKFQNKEQSRTILTYLALLNIFYGLYFILSFHPINLIQLKTAMQSINVLAFFLGILPLLVSVMFFIINTAYSLIHSALVENTKREYLRKLIYSNVLETPDSISTALFPLIDIDEIPKHAGKFIRSTLDELAVSYGGEIDALGDNNFVYHFKELNRHIMDVCRFRENVVISEYSFGETIFDSGV